MPMFNPEVNGTTLQNLYDIMGAGSAGEYAGSQRFMQNEMNGINKNLSLADLDKITIENDHNRVMNPMLQQVQGSAARKANLQDNTYWNGMLQGDLADARKKASDADYRGLEVDTKRRTLDSDVAKTNSANQTAVIQDMGKNMLNVIAYAGTIADPVQRQEAMRQLITHHGWDKNPSTAPVWDRLVNHPDMLGEGANLAKRLMEFDPQHLSKIADQTLKNKGTLDVANVQAAATRYSADARKTDTNNMFAKEWMKLDDAKKASVIDTLVAEAEALNQPVVEFPNGIKMGVPEAKELAKQLSIRAISRSPGNPQIAPAGLPRTDPRGDVIKQLYPDTSRSGPTLSRAQLLQELQK